MALLLITGCAGSTMGTGVNPKRTRLLLGAFGIRELVSDEDIERLAATRRDDLPGQPLVWQAALRSLVEQLTGTAPRAW